jgi:hypothetical protein
MRHLADGIICHMLRAMVASPTTDDHLGAAISVGVTLVWLVVVVMGLILEQAS